MIPFDDSSDEANPQQWQGLDPALFHPPAASKSPPTVAMATRKSTSARSSAPATPPEPQASSQAATSPAPRNHQHSSEPPPEAYEPHAPDPTIAQLRIPPQSVEAESSVLGGLLLDNGAWDTVGDKLVESDFFRYEHRLIYRALASMIESGRSADVVTTYEWLQSHGEAENAGGLVYLNHLAQFVPSAANINRYSEIVRERAVLRKIVSAGDEMITDAFNPQGKTPNEVLEKAERKLFALSEQGSKGNAGFKAMPSLVVKLLDDVMERADNPSDVTGLSTGYVDLDRMTSGLQPGDLIVLAARPSMGKTSLAINIAEHVAIKERLPVAVFSMEMGANQLAVRVVGSIARIDQGHLRTGKLTHDEWPRLTEAIETLKEIELHIDDTPGLTPAQMRSNARKLARQSGGLGLIVVDYLQLMSGGSEDGSADNRATVLGEISRSLKMLAKEMNCPVIALSQLNRAVEQRNDKRPMMSDLRESGAIEQDADIIMFIYRDEYYTKDACKEPGVAEIIIAKQRNGPTGVVKMAFLNALTRFETLAGGGY